MKKRSRFGGRFDKYHISRTDGTWSKKYQADGNIKHWDFAPDENYFKELFRVSDKQIIWGGNYFPLPISNNFIIWRKLTISENFSMAMAEYAWTNIKGNAKVFEYPPQDKLRFHPTQKPVKLYEWIIRHYAQPGYKILDTHGGSFSSAIAAYNMGYDFVGIEKDEIYYDKALKRIQDHLSQIKLF